MCKLIAITNRKLCKGDFLEQIDLLCKAGVDQIVLREKDLSEEAYLSLAKDVKEVCDTYQTPLFLHKFLHCYEKLPTAGIHLSVPDLVQYTEEIKGIPHIGVSTHSMEQVAVAKECGADYVFFGHVFETACKEGVPPRGVLQLEAICKGTSLPVYAIGGICGENISEVIKAGAKGACVMSFGMQAEEKQLRELVRICHEIGDCETPN